MKITFIGATHEVTGSCYYLEAAGKKFLVDCGMEQGPDYYENQEIRSGLRRSLTQRLLWGNLCVLYKEKEKSQ